MVDDRFYAEELQEVIKENEVYEVERILRKRKRNGKTEYFVKWVGDLLFPWLLVLDKKLCKVFEYVLRTVVSTR